MVIAQVPLWVCHQDNAGVDRAQHSLELWQGRQKCAIYSVDVHPSGGMFATAAGDGTVRLWNSQALFSKSYGSYSEQGTYVSSSSSDDGSVASESTNGQQQQQQVNLQQVHDLSSAVRRKKDGSPARKAAAAATHSEQQQQPPTAAVKGSSSKHPQRLLGTLSAHTGSSVLCVRFSPSGKYLASAGDDGAVCIYTENHEQQWIRIRLLRGHGLDVVDLAWAPDDSHLVSCSLDSATPIIVWKLTDLATSNTMIGTPWKILGQIHTSTVKGVAFDPAGTYFCSSGDDPAVCIWRAHDDWGLEQRIDASFGIFRQWKDGDTSLTGTQSMVRRLCWSTDGAFVCATNAVVKNKHVASTISRDGWTVSSADRAVMGAANLVGHKQPVVASRACRQLLAVRKKNNADEDEPDGATLLALGDRRGFVTVWSTRKSRPLFKLQCSESRCTVTDLAWGQSSADMMMLLVSLMDGQVVALLFAIPDEMGPFLSAADQARVFQLRYGIEDGGLRVGQTAGGASGLIENPLQLSLEDHHDENEDGPSPLDDDDENNNMASSPPPKETTADSVRQTQEETRLQSGKKRVRPVLMTVSDKRPKQTVPQEKETPSKKQADPMQTALEAAEQATAAAVGATAASQGTESSTRVDNNRKGGAPQTQQAAPTVVAITSKLPYDTDRIKSVDLPHAQDPLQQEQIMYVAECANSLRVPTGSQGATIPCIDLVIKRNNHVTWRDQLPGTSCSAIAASNAILAVGTTDGCVQLFGNSPSVGWTSGMSFRSHPPLIFGNAIVRLKLEEQDRGRLVLVVVTADGEFGVYTITPSLSLQYKGSILPAMTHMALGACAGGEASLPQLSRIQLTQSGRLFLLLSFAMHAPTDRNNGPSTTSGRCGVGGSLQAFVYDRSAELWLRVSDSRFVLSDFYSSLPTSKTAERGPLVEMEDAVKMGSLQSSLQSSHRNRSYGSDAIYSQAEEQTGNYVASRSHCEDRMACALALGSAGEFEEWLIRYVRTLAVAGNASQLRMLVDMLLGGSDASCSWLSSSPDVLQLTRKDLVRKVVSEMSKNRSLQRLTNEMSLEVETL